jgi:hypothetical protein
MGDFQDPYGAAVGFSPAAAAADGAVEAEEEEEEEDMRGGEARARRRGVRGSARRTSAGAEVEQAAGKMEARSDAINWAAWTAILYRFW